MNISRYVKMLFACLCMQIMGGGITIAAESEENIVRIRQIGLPLVEIFTVGGVNPTCEFVQPPLGCMGNGITNNTYVSGRMTITVGGEKIYDSGDYIKDMSGMRLKVRGNSSAYSLKQPYKVKLSKKADLLFRNDADYKDKEWLLLGNYQDTHTLQTVVGMKIGQMVGMDWQPAYQFAHVVLNGTYKGCYLICESVKKASKRCNISNSGYLIENDAYWWNTEDPYFHSDYLTPAMGYTFKFPDPDDLNETLVSNIKDYVEDFGKILQEAGDVSEYIDMASFAGWALGHDILGTLDGCGSNMFLYKDDYKVNDVMSTKLKMGPMWDFDSAFKKYGQWSAQHDIDHFYVKRLFQRQDFIDCYIKIWKSIRKDLYSEIINEVRSLQQKCGKAIMDCRRLEAELTNFHQSVELDENIDSVSTWFKSRIAWLDAEIEKIESSGCDSSINEDEIIVVTCYDMWGKMCFRLSEAECIKNTHNGRLYDVYLPKGVYVVNETLRNGSVRSRKVMFP